MNPQTVALTTTTSSVAVALVSFMVPNAIDSRPVADGTIERGYAAALASAAVLGFAVSLMDGNLAPFIGALLCAGLVIIAHNTIQHNGMVLT